MEPVVAAAVAVGLMLEALGSAVEAIPATDLLQECLESREVGQD